jgi:hypothetical protein
MKKDNIPHAPSASASVVLNFPLLKVLESMISKDKKNIKTLKYKSYLS